MFGALISALLGYLLGSIPFGLLVAQARGIDIRKHGSGNIGATNVLRTLGKKWGVLVFVLDALKGLIAVFLAERFFGIDLVPPGIFHLSAAQTGIVSGIACILGHNFPVWLRFKGGKGVATSAGVILGLVPLAVLAALLIWVAVFYGTRYVSLASIAAAFAIPVAVGIQLRINGMPFDSLFWFSIVVAAMAIWRHRPNIQRLLAGTENRFERKK